MIVRASVSEIEGRGLFAAHNIPAGVVLLDIRRDARLPAPLFHNTNHACAPNARVDERGCLVSEADIPEGGEVTINYLESCDFTDGFHCHCPDCEYSFSPAWVEKEFDPDGARVTPLIVISGQPGAGVICGVLKIRREPEGIPCLNR